MATTETPPADDGLTDDDAAMASLPGEMIYLARNGWVRLNVGDVALRLRPPFFGEYKAARVRMVAINEQVEDLSDDVALTAERLDAAATALEADESLSDRERSAARRKIMRESNAAARELTAAQEPLWLDWWAQIIGTLCVDQTAEAKALLADLDADRLPPYMAAAGAATRVLGHWRAGPLGRG